VERLENDKENWNPEEAGGERCQRKRQPHTEQGDE
jgi:hypothetical protein